MLSSSESESLDALRERFQKHLPAYGNLWRSMAPAATVKREPLSLLPAIENRLTVTLRVPVVDGNCQEGCAFDDCNGCAAPTFEIIEEADALRKEQVSPPSNPSSSTSVSDSSESSAYECDFNLSRVCDDDNGHDEEVQLDDDASIENLFTPKKNLFTPEKNPTTPLETYRETNVDDDSIAEESRENTSSEGELSEEDCAEDDNSSVSSAGNTVLCARKTPHKNDSRDPKEASDPVHVPTKLMMPTMEPQSDLSSCDSSSSSSDGGFDLDFSHVYDEKDIAVDSPKAMKPPSYSGDLPIHEPKADSHVNFFQYDLNKDDGAQYGSRRSDQEHGDSHQHLRTSFGGSTGMDLDFKSLSISNKKTSKETREGKSNPNTSSPIDLVDISSDNSVSTGSALDANEQEVGNTEPDVRKPFKAKLSSHGLNMEEHADSDSSEQEWDEENEAGSKDSQANSHCSKSEYDIVILSDSEEEQQSDEEWSDVGDDDAQEGSDSEVSNSDKSCFAKDNRETTRNSSLTEPPISKGNNSKAKALTSPSIPRKNTALSKTAFRRIRESLTKKTFLEFDSVVFSKKLESVEVTWSPHLRTTAGLTRLKKITRPGHAPQRVATIELSNKIIDEPHRMRSTLLHEMCHAAAWLVDGVSKPPHGSCFKKWAKLSMNRVRDVIVTTTHSYEISYKYAWACTTPKCGVVIQRHSRSIDPARQCCGRCKGKLMEIEVPGSNKSLKNVEFTPKKKKALSGFNLFVKQQSQVARQRLIIQRRTQGLSSNVTQSEVMKECARLWQDQKQQTLQAKHNAANFL